MFLSFRLLFMHTCIHVVGLLQLFDAALVANNKHAASWHGWGLLEKQQGNFKKARDLWMKVVRPSLSHYDFCCMTAFLLFRLPSLQYVLMHPDFQSTLWHHHITVSL